MTGPDPIAAPITFAIHQAMDRIHAELGVQLCDDCHMPSPHHLDVCKYVRQHTENRIAWALAEAKQ